MTSLRTSSRARLTRRHLPHFPGETLFDRLARAVCEAECLPRKELFETWEMARRVRRRVRGGRVVDLAAGHGLLAYTLLLHRQRSAAAEMNGHADGRESRRLPARWKRDAQR